MFRLGSTLCVTLAMIAGNAVGADKAAPTKKYFAHAVVEDQYGVIAPWCSATKTDSHKAGTC